MPSANDISNLPVLGQGFCLKADGNQKYTWDCEALGALKQVCSAYDIPYQMCVKRTGSTGGGTIGPMLSAHLPVKTADIGVPLLSMHSARELMGARDQIYITKAVKAFLSL